MSFFPDWYRHYGMAGEKRDKSPNAEVMTVAANIFTRRGWPWLRDSMKEAAGMNQAWWKVVEKDKGRFEKKSGQKPTRVYQT